MSPGDPERGQVSKGDLEPGLGAADPRQCRGTERTSPTWDPGGRPGERA